MYRISELALKVGLSRSAILYYEKLQLIAGTRLGNGYRVYNESDVQRIRLIQQLQLGGLSLAECKACVESEIDRTLLRERYGKLANEIEEKQRSLQLLGALIGETSQKHWHEALLMTAPDAHLDWLITQGFEEKEALRVKWLSKDMNDHDIYMRDFLTIFDTLERWGPGSKEETLKALKAVPHEPKSILEIGCGNGVSTLLLAKNTEASIVATDNEQSALDRLKTSAEKEGLSKKIITKCVSMTDLNFDSERFDLVWAEACAYIMGVENALHKWKNLLSENSILMLSDLVWLTDNPSEEPKHFWKSQYPDIQSIETRKSQIIEKGYKIIDNFTLSRNAWANYYGPLKTRSNSLNDQMADTQALIDINYEVEIYEKYLGEFGYQVFILKKI